MGILRSDRVSGLGGANAINGSVKFSGGTDAFIVPPSSDFNFGTGDYTIEAWVYPEEEDRSQMIYAVGDSDSTAAMGKFYFRSTNKFTYWCQSAAQITSTTTYTRGSWYHVALVNNSGTQTLYVNGTSQGTSTYGSGFGGDAFDVNVGKNPSNAGQSFNGYISNLRVQKGKAEYTAAFTTPTTRLEKTPETVLLCCQSPGSLTQEATGKSLIIGKTNNNDSGPVVTSFAPDVGEDHGTTLGDNTKFDTLSYMVPPGGTTTQSNRGRAVLAGGYTTVNPANGTLTIEYLQIQSGGLVKDFGELSEDRKFSAGLASGTRGVIGGSDGTPSWSTGTMEYVTIATTSNTTSFGNMTNTAGMVSAHSNNTRGLFFSVWDANTSGSSHKKHIDYITIATAGNSADFGELTVQRPEAGGFGSSTRGICAGGYDALSPFNAQDTIDYVTIATTGNATDFGNLTVARQASGSASSSTRGIIAGGYVGPNSYTNHIDYVTIASTGDATDFGDTVTGRNGIFVGNCSNQINGVFAGGTTANGVFTNTIDYVTIATTGNAQDFGDLTYATPSGSALTDCHGGLS